MHTTPSDHLPLHQVKDGPSGVFTKRRRPHQHLPPRVASLRCRVEATSLCDRPCLAWLPPRLIFHVRVRDIESNATWLTHCSLRDIHGLYRHLVDRAVDPATIQALQVLRCPGVPLLQRRDGLVIKAMCADTEHFLHNLLAVCRATCTAPDGAFVAFFVAAFLRKKPPGHDTLRPL
ncbi:hypothetical protein H310_12549 [Aphanomyces invadans]|uniref:Uncharacterized protein n=1 Tax=Aphanomyces invadans TaxID=157072 RepID=A0A024TJJ9_9STRA|nr:hypothetical protein H310_12549 [Aphanomyces invadans]ETV93507.1 hypothetical protein H310_12549 [Aphanomyces invadans]|eukprot:XP_008877849.1 hypothetical protein H310_12549 [Aphanomyces invadans]